MDDIIASIRGHINERLNSPLFGAYALAWLFFNYKVPIMLFSDLDVHQKMFQIDSYLHSTPDRIYYVYGWPLAIAAAYIFILPIPSFIVTAWNLGYQLALGWMQQKILRLRVISEKEMHEALAAIGKILEEKDNRIRELEAQHENLRSQRARAETELADVSVKWHQADEKNKAMPGLEQRLASADEQVKKMASEILGLNQTIRVRNEELNVTSEVLKNVASSANKIGLSKAFEEFVKNAASGLTVVPPPIEALMASLAGLNTPGSSGHHIRLAYEEPVEEETGLGYFKFNSLAGLSDGSRLYKSDMISFLLNFKAWINGVGEITDATLRRLVELIDSASTDEARVIFECVRSGATNFEDIPGNLIYKLQSIIES